MHGSLLYFFLGSLPKGKNAPFVNIQNGTLAAEPGKTRLTCWMSGIALKYAGEWNVFYASRLDCQNKLFPARHYGKSGEHPVGGNREPSPLGFQISPEWRWPCPAFSIAHK